MRISRIVWLSHPRITDQRPCEEITLLGLPYRHVDSDLVKLHTLGFRGSLFLSLSIPEERQ